MNWLLVFSMALILQFAAPSPALALGEKYLGAWDAPDYSAERIQIERYSKFQHLLKVKSYDKHNNKKRTNYVYVRLFKANNQLLGLAAFGDDNFTNLNGNIWAFSVVANYDNSLLTINEFKGTICTDNKIVGKYGKSPCNKKAMSWLTGDTNSTPDRLIIDEVLRKKIFYSFSMIRFKEK